MGVCHAKKKRRKSERRDPPNWDAHFAYLTAPAPGGRGYTYREARELTIPQLRHALGNAKVPVDDGSELFEACAEALDNIIRRLRIHPVDLLHLPFPDLSRQLAAENPAFVLHPIQLQNLLVEYHQIMIGK